jgi:hypothetical protein
MTTTTVTLYPPFIAGWKKVEKTPTANVSKSEYIETYWDGTIKMHSTLSCQDASDHEEGLSELEGLFFFFIKSPQIGIPIITAHFEAVPNLPSYCSGNIENECGYSSIQLIEDTVAIVYVFAYGGYQVPYLNYRLDYIDSYSDYEADDHSWNKPLWVGKKAAVFNLGNIFGLGSVLQKNDWLVVSVGAAAGNWLLVDDVTVTSHIDVNIRLASLEVKFY